MPAPIVSWYDPNNNAVSQWNIGTVDAGSVSADFTVDIWNNKGGTNDVSTMQNCQITTKDSAGGNTGELVTDTWIKARCDSLQNGSADTFGAIGGTITKTIEAEGATNPGEISGLANTGDPNAAADNANFARVTLHAEVPPTATAGNVVFLTRVSYQYV
ncbi:hypothetical protein U472_00200 [Orenia metallireducens]|uniref:Uncharacterized protein n=1 Tax=Orenia metallireducens TaxID=1413210 RepID=A0A1C0AD80_9FIRM|nr:hypothetical protein [Orenia metallireducens]OCL28613.1 hypothetical protein U472_00200 [Orenia metallireducens]